MFTGGPHNFFLYNDLEKGFLEYANKLVRKDKNETINYFQELKPDIVIIPSLAYSLHGNRLGFGMGYYDKYFNKIDVNSKIIKLGVCFHEYLYEYLPTEDHDIKMDYIITLTL